MPEWLKPVDPNEQIDPAEIVGMDEFENWENERNNPEARIKRALEIAFQDAGVDGEHHKMWVIDQMVRVLTGSPAALFRNFSASPGPIVFAGLGESEEYKEFVRKYNEVDAEEDHGEDITEEERKLFEEMYPPGWDEGIAP